MALAFLLAFALGSIPFGLWWGLAVRRIDVRLYGSRNLGATNVYRVLGPAHGILVLLLDAAKGTVAVLVARSLGLPPLAILAAGLAAILGHMLSPWVRFRGGKGVATGLGVWVSLAPVPTLLVLVIWSLALVLSRRVSVASLAAAAGLPLLVAVLPGGVQSGSVVAFAVLTALLVWIRHRANLRRLLQGQEPPLWGKRT